MRLGTDTTREAKERRRKKRSEREGTNDEQPSGPRRHSGVSEVPHLTQTLGLAVLCTREKREEKGSEKGVDEAHLRPSANLLVRDLRTQAFATSSALDPRRRLDGEHGDGRDSVLVS